MDIAQFLQNAATALGGMLMFMFCIFLFIAVIGAAMATLEMALTLAKLPGLLIGLLSEYVLVKTTRLDHFNLAAARCAVGACVFAAIAGGVAAACGATTLPVLSFAFVGALYGVMSTVIDGLGREFWQPRKSIEPRE